MRLPRMPLSCFVMADVSAPTANADTDITREAEPVARTPVPEVLNSITHAIGAGLSIAGLVVLLVVSGETPSPWKYAGFSIYGVTQIALYLASALLHGLHGYPRARAVLSRLDHSFIFVLIAGTYTPACLILLRKSVGWLLLGLIWGLALVGITLKAILAREKWPYVSILYVPMGWVAFAFYRPLVEATSPAFMALLIAGGICYTGGIAFYAWRRLPFAHLVWHLFVLAGGTLLYLAYLLHVA